jgi:hypothetical protein
VGLTLDGCSLARVEIEVVKAVLFRDRIPNRGKFERKSDDPLEFLMVNISTQ